MVRIHTRIGLSYEVGTAGADFIFNIQAAKTPQQNVVSERLSIQPSIVSKESTDPTTCNRILQLFSPAGRLDVVYQCTVDIKHHIQAPADTPEIPLFELPASVLQYLYPSRYCQSDCLGQLVMGLFGALPRGYSRVQAVVDWVQQQVTFKSNSSNSATSALDTLRDRVGVCRDFAHLMIALCRALNIPARFTTGIDYGADPALGPPDFHAYVEVYLGHRWYIFDPSGTAIPMGFIRIGTGKDAADVSFATIIGEFRSASPWVQIDAEHRPDGGFEVPVRKPLAISTTALI